MDSDKTYTNMHISFTLDALRRPPTSFNFTAVPGISLPIPRNATPLQYFELFMTMSVWQYIMQTTNHYARVRLGSTPLRRRSVFRNWRDITLVEKKAFVGVIIQMGFVQLTQIKDYWSTHVTLNLPFFRSVFFTWQVPADLLDAACRRTAQYHQTQQNPALSWHDHPIVPAVSHSI